ncbi:MULTISPECIES: DMT family transporter [Cupriavidus]|uniref:EamA/RhaT family transporter n=1 Tax=Cupriavidus pauculus TaxID=82633 RepID=A0A3G8GVZ2_9BURK|nr:MULTISPECIES: EamA family transporter [Cupriavidus]AZG12426.1 EamA/RhaT family transporter [Cupriavidus pauculus]MDT6960712.1 EamA family transporter [Cupriavidus sp. SZY C1]
MTLAAWLGAAGAIVLWASFATLVSRAPDVPPLLLTGLALCAGSLTCVHRLRDWRVPLRTLAFGVACLFVYNAGLVMAFRLAPIAEANLINYLWPLILVLLGTPVWRGADGVAKIAGALLGFGGCIVAILSGPGGVAFSPAYAAGYAMALLAAVVWAVYSLGARWLPPFSSWAVGGFCLGAGLLAIASHLVLEPPAALPLASLGWVLAIGLGPLGIAFVLWDYAMRHGNAAQIGVLGYGTPVLSMLGLALAGHVRDRDWSMVFLACTLIVAGVALASTGAVAWRRRLRQVS